MCLMNEKPRCLIFKSKDSLAPKGGPSAVCYYYMKEQERRKVSDFDFLPNIQQNDSIHKKESKWKHTMPNILFQVYEWLKQVIKYNMFLGGHYPIALFDYSVYDIVHFHDVRELYMRRYELENYKGIVVLQSHTPQPPSHELYNAIPANIRFFIPFLRKRLERMDRCAFERADYIIFPCEDAEEPYYNDWKDYKAIHEKKKDHYKYVLTGIPAATPRRTKEEVYKELSIPPTDFMVSYVGRHNEVKGYGDLKLIGERFLNSDIHTWVVCAGNEEPLKRLEHDRWVEIGWTSDAHSYISAADVFVLPNKETYFDIVMLEVLSLGKIVIASRTGGNKFFEKAGCKGVFLYDTVEEAVSLLNKVKNLSEEERKSLGDFNHEFFMNNNTVTSMYDQYLNVIHEIFQEGK